jgi:hypothetical protein
MNVGLILKNFKITNIKHFIIGYFGYFKFKYFDNKSLEKELQNYTDNSLDNFKDSSKHIQILQRYKDVLEKSPECLKNGSCKICGCSMPAMLFSDKVCEGNCYKEFIK